MRPEGERIAALETEVGHLTKTIDELKAEYASHANASSEAHKKLSEKLDTFIRNTAIANGIFMGAVGLVLGLPKVAEFLKFLIGG